MLQQRKKNVGRQTDSAAPEKKSTNHTSAL